MLSVGGCSKARPTVVLVRHAEKVIEDGDRNPNLTEMGWQRAEALSRVAALSSVDAIFVTELCRTAQTALPLARTSKKPLHVQNVGASGSLKGCSPAIDVPLVPLPADVAGPDGLARWIRKAGHIGTVVVVGHSNTIPEVVTALGGSTVPPIEEKTGYDGLYIVTPGDGPTTLVARYGPRNPDD